MVEVPIASDAFAWLRRIIEPRSAVEGREARRRARYTALCFVLLIPLGIVALGISLLSPDPGSTGLDMAAMLVGLVLIVALYPVSRGPNFAMASHVAIGTVSLGIWLPWLMSGTHDTQILYFACIPLIMGGLLVGAMSAAAFSLANVAAAFGITPILVISEGVDVGTAFSIPFFLLFVGGFAVNAAHLRDRDLKEVEDMARELADHEKRRVAMLNNVAHDLASPLTPLKLQLALVQAEKPVPQPRIDILRRNVAQLERLVSDIKDLARAEDGGFKLHTRSVDVQELVGAAVASFRPQAEASGIALTLDARAPAIRSLDPERVTQVLYNLLSNALKFTPTGGSVSLRLEDGSGPLLLHVSDTGRGLAPEERARLFQPFSQVHERSEVKERGTGLGLYISRGIMRAHAGDLTVASEGRGKGSTFTILWPEA